MRAGGDDDKSQYLESMTGRLHPNDLQVRHQEENNLTIINSKHSQHSQRDSHHLRESSRNTNGQRILYQTQHPSTDYEYENPRRGPSPRNPDIFRSSSNNRDSKMQSISRKYTGRDDQDYYRGPYHENGGQQIERRESWKQTGRHHPPNSYSPISPGRSSQFGYNQHTPLANAGQAMLGGGAASHRNADLYRQRNEEMLQRQRTD